MTKRNWLAVFGLVAFVSACGVIPRIVGGIAAAQSSYAGKYPVFEVDTSWPQSFPNNWVFGLVSKIVVDKHDKRVDHSQAAQRPGWEDRRTASSGIRRQREVPPGVGW